MRRALQELLQERGRVLREFAVLLRLPQSIYRRLATALDVVSLQGGKVLSSHCPHRRRMSIRRYTSMGWSYSFLPAPGMAPGGR